MENNSIMTKAYVLMAIKPEDAEPEETKPADSKPENLHGDQQKQKSEIDLLLEKSDSELRERKSLERQSSVNATTLMNMLHPM